jgi:translocation and assembly module TamB
VPTGDVSAGGTKGPAPAAANGAPSTRPRAGEPGLPLFVAQGLQLQLRHAPELLEARLQPGQAEVLGVALTWSEARWEGRGEAPPQLALQAEVQPVAVAPLLQRLQPEFGWAGDLRIGARARVDSAAAVTAHVEIARTGGDLQFSEFGSVQSLGLSDARLALEADQGRWQLTQLIAGANLGRVEGRQVLRADPRALWPGDDAAIEGELRVQVDNLATWGAWVPAGWRLGGQVDAALRIAGQLGAPQLIGEAHGRELALRNAIEGVALADGGFDARFDGSSAQLVRLRDAAGEGELVASGDARLDAEPQARLELSATRATVLGRVDRRVVASGAATLRMEGDKIAVDGDFRADSGRVDISRADAPSLGDDVTVRRGGDTDEQDAVDAAAARRGSRAIDLRLKVDLGSRFRLRGRGIDTRLTGAVTLTTPNGLLTAHGEIRTDQGTYEAYGQKLEIERGVITFVGAIDNPRLDIEAIRANSDVRVGVRVSGNVLSPRIALFSDPEMPATDKLALLVTGRSYDSLAGSEALLLQRAAMALLAGDGSGGGPGLDPARLLKLDELSVRQSEGTTRDTVVSLGKQISDRVYLGYERGLNATAGNWQLVYRIAQRFTLRAQSGEDSAIDLVWLFRWN